MNHDTHFENARSVFSKVECQYACALVLYVRTKNHPRRPVDHSQPPTLTMLEDILQEARWSIWNSARRNGHPCNAVPPNAPLNAYCLVRNLRHDPYRRWWYDEVRDQPDIWYDRAYDMFQNWLLAGSPVVRHLTDNGTLARYYE